MVPCFVSTPLVLMGFFPVSFQHWLMETFSTPRTSLRTASPLHAPFEPRRDPTILLWHRPSTLPHESNRAPAQSVHLNSSDCASSVFGLSSRRVQLAFHLLCASWGCMVYVANLLPKTLADFRVQILTTIGAFHLSGNMWAVCEEAHSFSITPVSCVTKRVEDMPALKACHAREGELQCH